MNYTFKLAHDMRGGKTPTTITVEDLAEEFRPSVGTHLTLNRVSNKTWRVVRVEPPNNPTGQSNTYFVEEVVPFVPNIIRTDNSC